MNPNINAIFFDLGGTLRAAAEDKAYTEAAKKRMAELAGTDLDYQEFYKLVNARYKDYRAWVLRFYCEAPEDILWTRWLCPELDHTRLRENASKLTFEWRQVKAKGRRTVVPGGVQTIKELYHRGYTLGIISDLVGCYEVDEWLNEDGLRPYFTTVQQSSITLIRKPNPAIYFYALRDANCAPENACYVGDNLERDILGAKATGFGLTIAVEYGDQIHPTEEQMPDGKIKAMTDLLDLFPARGTIDPAHLKPVF